MEPLFVCISIIFKFYFQIKIQPHFTCILFSLIPILQIPQTDALTKHMAVEWGPQNIRVVGLAPGPIAETEGMRKLGKGLK